MTLHGMHISEMKRILTSGVNALSKISKISSFKHRKMIANGIVMSHISHLIQLWGGCSGYLLDILQILQNRAARLVTGLNWFTSRSKLLQQCGWLSVRQMVIFYDLVLVYKIRRDKKPVYLYDKLGRTNTYNTRQMTETSIKPPDTLNTKIAKTSFINRAITAWNNLPNELRLANSLGSFKIQTKLWVKENIPI